MYRMRRIYMNRNVLLSIAMLVASNACGMDRVLGFVTCGYYQKKSITLSIRRNASSLMQTEIVFRPVAAIDSFNGTQTFNFEINGKEGVGFTAFQNGQKHYFPLNQVAIEQIQPVLNTDSDLVFIAKPLKKSTISGDQLEFTYKIGSADVKKGYAVCQAFLERAKSKLENKLSFEKRDNVTDVNVTVQKSGHIFFPDIVVSRCQETANLPLNTFVKLYEDKVFDHLNMICKLSNANQLSTDPSATVSFQQAKEVIDSLSFLQRFCLKTRMSINSVRYQLMTVGLIASCVLMYKKFIQSAE